MPFEDMCHVCKTFFYHNNNIVKLKNFNNFSFRVVAKTQNNTDLFIDLTSGT